MSDKPKGIYAEYSGGKREVKFLQPYFKRGKRWYKLKGATDAKVFSANKKKS